MFVNVRKQQRVNYCHHLTAVLSAFLKSHACLCIFLYTLHFSEIEINLIFTTYFDFKLILVSWWSVSNSPSRSWLLGLSLSEIKVSVSTSSWGDSIFSGTRCLFLTKFNHYPLKFTISSYNLVFICCTSV